MSTSTGEAAPGAAAAGPSMAPCLSCCGEDASSESLRLKLPNMAARWASDNGSLASDMCAAPAEAVVGVPATADMGVGRTGDASGGVPSVMSGAARSPPPRCTCGDGVAPPPKHADSVEEENSNDGLAARVLGDDDWASASAAAKAGAKARTTAIVPAAAGAANVVAVAGAALLADPPLGGAEAADMDMPDTADPVGESMSTSLPDTGDTIVVEAAAAVGWTGTLGVEAAWACKKGARRARLARCRGRGASATGLAGMAAAGGAPGGHDRHQTKRKEGRW